MAKTVTVIFLCFLALSGPKLAHSAAPCEGFEPILAFSPLDITRAFDNIRNGTDLEQYSSPDGTQYWLCFQSVTGEAIRVGTQLHLENTTDRPVVLSGLRIEAEGDLERTVLTITGNQPVIFQNSRLENCRKCLNVENKHFRMENNVEIECSGRDQNSLGVLLLEDRNTLFGSFISRCDVAIQIGTTANRSSENQIGPENQEEIDDKKMRIYESGIVLKVGGGDGNVFTHNWIFEEPYDGGMYRWDRLDENIVLERGANGGLPQPLIYSVTGEALTGQPEWVLNYPPHIRSGIKTLASFDVQFPYRSGQAEMTKAEIDIPSGWRSYSPGQFFYQHPRLDRVKRSGWRNSKMTYKIPVSWEETCKVSHIFFQHPAYGSTPFSKGFILNPPFEATESEFTCESPPGIPVSHTSLDTEIVSAPPNSQTPMGVVEDYIEEIPQEDGEEEEMGPDAVLGTGEPSGLAGGTAAAEASGGFGFKCALDAHRQGLGPDFILLLLLVGMLLAGRALISGKPFFLCLLLLWATACQKSDEVSRQPAQEEAEPQPTMAAEADTVVRFHFHKDADSDGFGDPAKELILDEDSLPGGYARNSQDCNDADDQIHPQSGISENFNGRMDYNCDGIYYWLPTRIINEKFIGQPPFSKRTLRELEWDPEARSISILVYYGDTPDSGVNWSYQYELNGDNNMSAFKFFWAGLDSEVFDSKSYSYDAKHGLLSVERRHKGNLGEVLESKTYEYYPDARLKTLKEWEGDAGETLHYSWEYFYDGEGRLTRYEATTGGVDFVYDEEGRLLEERRSLSTDHYLYDEFGRLAGVARFTGDYEGQEPHYRFTYDENNRRTSASKNEGIVETYTYDDNGNLKTYHLLQHGSQTREYEEILEYTPIREPVGIDLEWLSPVKIKVR